MIIKAKFRLKDNPRFEHTREVHNWETNDVLTRLQIYVDPNANVPLIKKETAIMNHSLLMLDVEVVYDE